LILSDFVEACIEESTLLDEAGEPIFDGRCHCLAQLSAHRLHALSQTNQGQVTLPLFVLDVNHKLGMRSCLSEEGEGDRLVGLLYEVHIT